MMMSCGWWILASSAKRTASAQLTNRPPRSPSRSRATQFPRLFWPIRKAEPLNGDCDEESLQSITPLLTKSVDQSSSTFSWFGGVYFACCAVEVNGCEQFDSD